MTEHAGDIFLTDAYGSIISTMAAPTVEGCLLPRSARTLKMNIAIKGPIPGYQYPNNLFYLVEPEGELLFVESGPVYNGQPIVYRVDTKNRLLEPVRSIGRRALFISRHRCISVDASKVQIVDAGIYYADLSKIRSYDPKAQAWQEDPEFEYGYGVGGLTRTDDERIFCLDELLAKYYDYYDGCASD